MTTGKTIALTRQTFVGKVLSLLFNILSWLFIILWRERKFFTEGGWEGRGIGVVGEAPEKAMAPHSSTLA